MWTVWALMTSAGGKGGGGEEMGLVLGGVGGFGRG